MELLARFELATSSLPRMRSTDWAIAACRVSQTASVLYNTLPKLSRAKIKKIPENLSAFDTAGFEQRNNPWLLVFQRLQPRVTSVHSYYLTSLVNLSFYSLTRLPLNCDTSEYINYSFFLIWNHLLSRKISMSEDRPAWFLLIFLSDSPNVGFLRSSLFNFLSDQLLSFEVYLYIGITSLCL